jgi:phospholipase/carboxylesterase
MVRHAPPDWPDNRPTPRALGSASQSQTQGGSWLNMRCAVSEGFFVSDALFIQRPAGAAQQLFLLFHGVGGTPGDMQALGERLAQAFPQAAIVGVAAAFACDLGHGRQWFSVQGIDDANRPERVAQALPLFLAEVQRWQLQMGVPAAATALIGFSQGAILALEASKQTELLAARVVGIAGRFITLPAQMHANCTIHLIHGKSDGVMPYGLTVQAAEHLVAMGADVTADVLLFVRHEMPGEVMDLVLDRLQGHIPQARWREALAAEALAQGR